MTCLRIALTTAVTVLVLRAAAAQELPSGETEISPIGPPPSATTHRDAVLFGRRLITLSEVGQLSAWDIETDERSSAPPPVANGGRFLASDATRLWCATRTAVWALADFDVGWVKGAEFDGKDEVLQGLAIVDGKPVLILEHRVIEPTEPREYGVPPGTGQLHEGRGLRVHAVLVEGHRLWIGTGYGEWGGELLGLDLETGTWVQSTDASHDVTGLAGTDSGSLTAMWAMSHLGASMELRVHASDTSVSSSCCTLDGEYGQGLAWSGFDRTLYTVQTDHLAQIRDGAAFKLARLDGEIFAPEPHAVGVAPGIVAILPAAARSVLVVPRQGAPWHWRPGGLRVLPED